MRHFHPVFCRDWWHSGIHNCVHVAHACVAVIRCNLGVAIQGAADGAPSVEALIAEMPDDPIDFLSTRLRGMSVAGGDHPIGAVEQVRGITPG